MKPSALAFVVAAAVLSASCVCDVAPDEPLGDAVEPGVHYGAGKPTPPRDEVAASHAWLAEHRDSCGEACFDVFVNICAEADACAGADPTDPVTCAGQLLTCGAAEHAATGELWGLAYCWRSCKGLD